MNSACTSCRRTLNRNPISVSLFPRPNGTRFPLRRRLRRPIAKKPLLSSETSSVRWLGEVCGMRESIKKRPLI